MLKVCARTNFSSTPYIPSISNQRRKGTFEAMRVNFPDTMWTIKRQSQEKLSWLECRVKRIKKQITGRPITIALPRPKREKERKRE